MDPAWGLPLFCSPLTPLLQIQFSVNIETWFWTWVDLHLCVASHQTIAYKARSSSRYLYNYGPDFFKHIFRCHLDLTPPHEALVLL